MCRSNGFGDLLTAWAGRMVVIMNFSVCVGTAASIGLHAS
jgi:hypothetical protein